MALQELKHPYTCGYKEFFVTWDKEVFAYYIVAIVLHSYFLLLMTVYFQESAMFVCIVMKYYKLGKRILPECRHLEEAAGECKRVLSFPNIFPKDTM